jgi:two-component system sensor histidine kinase PhoQ
MLAMTLVSTAVTLISLVFIDQSYRKEWLTAAEENLKLHVFSLLSVSQIGQEQLSLPVISHHPRLNTSGSGLIAAVFDNAGNLIWQSLSTPVMDFSIATRTEIGQWDFYEFNQETTHYLASQYRIEVPNNGESKSYLFLAAEESKHYDQQLQAARLRLLVIFTIIFIALIISQFIGLRLAFKPITSLEREVADLEKGSRSTLSDHYPKEIAGVATNINKLIEKESSLREKYRSNMADLAHSLKTPVAIIRNELPGQVSQDVQSAIQRIDNTIEYQLRRAVISDHSLLKRGTDFANTLDQVITALQKIYRGRAITFRSTVDKQLSFAGDENELMEILGNLIDNAYKHAKSQIAVSATKIDNRISVIIEDDGPGFSSDESKLIFQRGARLDDRGFGQGIGLAVVVDIVNQYDGSIDAQTSSLGGAKFHLALPLGIPIDNKDKTTK